MVAAVAWEGGDHDAFSELEPALVADALADYVLDESVHAHETLVRGREGEGQQPLKRGIERQIPVGCGEDTVGDAAIGEQLARDLLGSHECAAEQERRAAAITLEFLKGDLPGCCD